MLAQCSHTHKNFYDKISTLDSRKRRFDRVCFIFCQGLKNGLTRISNKFVLPPYSSPTKKTQRYGYGYDRIVLGLMVMVALCERRYLVMEGVQKEMEHGLAGRCWRRVPVKGESVQEVLDAAPGEHAEREQSCDVQQLRQTT